MTQRNIEEEGDPNTYYLHMFVLNDTLKKIPCIEVLLYTYSGAQQIAISRGIISQF